MWTLGIYIVKLKEAENKIFPEPGEGMVMNNTDQRCKISVTQDRLALEIWCAATDPVHEWILSVLTMKKK
jgi:hypothetical protein